MRFSAAPNANSWQPRIDLNSQSLSYWLNWRIFFCAVLILLVMAVASILIWKHEGSKEESREEEEEEEEEEAWRPCLKTMHPAWLLVYRILAFIILVAVMVASFLVNGASQLYYYTIALCSTVRGAMHYRWTFALVIIYFGLGLLLSAYGCHEYVRVSPERINSTPSEAAGGSDISLADVETSTGPLTMRNPGFRKHLNVEKIVRLGNYLFQIIYQTNAGAILLTDFIFWFIIFPFLVVKDYNLSFLQVGMHSLNAIFFICDTALNRLQFRWFRMAYFMLWSSSYVIFQWVLHACIPFWWPYTFLELSSANSPMWYFAVTVFHVPCYAAFHMIIKLKHYLLLRWFSDSYYLNKQQENATTEVPYWN